MNVYIFDTKQEAQKKADEFWENFPQSPLKDKFDAYCEVMPMKDGRFAIPVPLSDTLHTETITTKPTWVYGEGGFEIKYKDVTSVKPTEMIIDPDELVDEHENLS